MRISCMFGSVGGMPCEGYVYPTQGYSEDARKLVGLNLQCTVCILYIILTNYIRYITNCQRVKENKMDETLQGILEVMKERSQTSK